MQCTYIDLLIHQPLSKNKTYKVKIMIQVRKK